MSFGALILGNQQIPDRWASWHFLAYLKYLLIIIKDAATPFSKSEENYSWNVTAYEVESNIIKRYFTQFCHKITAKLCIMSKAMISPNPLSWYGLGSGKQHKNVIKFKIRVKSALSLRRYCSAWSKSLIWNLMFGPKRNTKVTLNTCCSDPPKPEFVFKFFAKLS